MNTKIFWRIFGGFVAGLLFASTAVAQDAVDNIVVVLDGSGSMAEKMPKSQINKITAAKTALKEVLKTVPRETHVGLLVFSAHGVDRDWLYPLGPRDDVKLMEAIDLPSPGSSTPLGEYIKKGADRLLEERAKQFGYGTFRLLVVTDGEATDGNLMERYTPEVIARGITVDVIGVAMNQRHTLATKVHSYRSANDPGSLKRAVAEVFGEIGGRGDDVAGAEAFAELKPIPIEAAQAMIQALSSSGNQPIGERPRKSQPPAEVPGSTPDASQNLSTPPQASSPMPQASSPVANNNPGMKRFVLFPIAGAMSCFGFALIVLVLIVRAMKNSRR